MCKVLAVGGRCEVVNAGDEVCLIDIRKGVGTIVGDIRDLHMFNDGEFDRIECHHVIEHIWPSEVNGALLELKRVLKVGGLLEISLPDMMECARTLILGNTEVLANMFGTFEDPEATSHKFGYYIKTFEPLLRRAGFKKVMIISRKDMHEMRFECVK